MRKQLLTLSVLGLALGTVLVTGCNKNSKSESVISIRNLYFSSYSGGDPYLSEIEEKFDVKFSLKSYTYNNWSTQVNGDIMGENLPDVFHANIDSYNFANTYKFWAEDGITKAIPDNLSRWPNVKELIESTTNIDSLKVNGKLYGIPVAKNTTDYDTSFSPFTYLYRRDWAKQWGVYQENDEYTWDQFKALLEKFRVEFAKNDKYSTCYPLADVQWGFPSIPNFYKQVPHCFAQDETTHKYVNNYTTDEYIQGMEEAKTFMRNGWYYPDNQNTDEETLRLGYTTNQFGVFYENLSYENYYKIKQALRSSNPSVSFNVDDAAAIMKIKGPDGKYHIEGTDNWFSMTLFDAEISDEKLNKILDIYDYLLSPEGTIFAVYGIEGFDYYIDGGEIKLIEENWDRQDDGSYAPKSNGGRYLRYCVSLGYDLLGKDPLTEKQSVTYLNSWETEMKAALAVNKLYVLIENAEVRWLTTPKKSEFSGGLRERALGIVKKYVYGQIASVDAYKGSFESTWTTVLNEINSALGY